MGKEETSAEWLEDMSHDYGGLIRRKDQGSALVIGSNKDGNIGHTIAGALRFRNGMDVADPPIEELDARMSFETQEYLRQHGPFDTLILAHGQTHLDWIENQPDAKIYEQIDNSLASHIVASKNFVRATLEHPWVKNIVFIGSMAYRKVLNGSSVYCAAKAGLAHYAECLGYELTPKGYRVYCVHPSNVKGTPMTEQTIDGLMRYRRMDREEAIEYWSHDLRMPEFLRASDIANVVAELVDPAGSSFEYLTGTNIELTGGQR